MPIFATLNFKTWQPLVFIVAGYLKKWTADIWQTDEGVCWANKGAGYIPNLASDKFKLQELLK